jgi:hypothetical protein
MGVAGRLGRVRGPGTAKQVVFGIGGGIAGTVYGTIVVMAVIAAGSRGADSDPSRILVFVAATVLVLWAAHVYAHALSDSLAAERRLAWVELRRLARREASVPLAAVAPVGALGLGALEVIREQSAIRLALAIGVATLAVQGLRYARIERLGRPATLAAVAVNLALGLTIVALEVMLAH